MRKNVLEVPVLEDIHALKDEAVMYQKKERGY